MRHFSKGLNLGGWLSQYPAFDEDHFINFIHEDDIKQIADWGFDHVRLPVDYPVMESDEAPGVYREQGFAHIDRCFEWCGKSGLNLVFDLHHAPGFTFINALQAETMHLNTLFEDAQAQERFLKLWECILGRYAGHNVPTLFELLNEVVLPDSNPWNELVAKSVARIREKWEKELLLIGSNQNNHAAELKHLSLLEDPHVIYGFHAYEPLLFTHQKAYWVEISRQLNRNYSYGGMFDGLKAFLSEHPNYEQNFGWLTDRSIDKNLLSHYMEPVVEFINSTGRDLYCGEFGVIEIAHPTCRAAWVTDMLSLMGELNIGWAYWSYKEMDFGLVDQTGQLRDPLLLKALTST